MGAATEKGKDGVLLFAPPGIWEGNFMADSGFRKGRGTSENRKVIENINPTEVEQLSANRRPKSKALPTLLSINSLKPSISPCRMGVS